LEVQHEGGVANLSKCDKFILNGASAKGADGFCGLQLEDGTIIKELHQNKHIQVPVDKSLFETEWKKSAKGDDFFILFTTHSSSLKSEDLVERTGLVSSENYRDYFGPFAARAFQQWPFKISINHASRAQLESVPGIGLATAQLILSEREKREFTSQDDFKKRIQSVKTDSLFQYFSFPHPKQKIN
jgi:hypothetical protein